MYRIILSAFLFCFFSCTEKQKETPKKEGQEKSMNVLFIAVDDLRPELNFYGAGHIKSPHLDKLAEESTVFERAYCNVPVCGASRASLLTGMRPTRKRFLNFKTKKDVDLPNAVSLPMIFKNNGYTTISNGKVYHHNLDDEKAWDSIWHPEGNTRDYQLEENIRLNSSEDGTRGYPYEKAGVSDSAYFDGRIANKGIEDLRKLKNNDKPFFLALGFMKPHLPFNAPVKYWDMYNEANITLPENYKQPTSTPSVAYHNYGELRSYYSVPKKGDVDIKMAKKMLHGYYACVSYVDAQIGRVLQELEHLGMAENTIVILWGDHGYNLGDHKMWCKHCTFESSIRTPLIIRVPGITNGDKTKEVTEYVDIYPTLCELTGIEAPKNLEGASFVPLLKNNGQREKKHAISKFKDAVVLIKDDFRYTEWVDDEGKTYARMLFDHKTDPLELENLAEKEAYQETVKQLSKMLKANWGENFLTH